MGSRRSFLGAFAAAALTAPLQVVAQPKHPRVVLATRIDALAEAFVAGLRDHGWRDGRNMAFERLVTRSDETIATDLQQVLGGDPAVVVLAGAISIGHAVKLTRRTPLVGVDLETDPVAIGLARSLARPGGNITGVWLDLPELAGKNLQLLIELVPGLPSLGVIRDERVGRAQLDALQASARAARVALYDGVVRSADEVDAAIARVSKEGARALIVLTAPGLFVIRARVADLALKHRLPLASLFAGYPDAGALVAYGPSLPGMFRQAAGHADRILRGAKPGAIPIERPVKFELVVNAITAKKLGIAIPESLRLRADRVIDA